MVFLGLPWLAGVFGTFFTGLVGFLATFLTKRIAVAAAAISAVLILLGTFTLAATTAINSVIASYPVGVVAYGLSMLPSNTDTCIAAILTVRIAGYTYFWMNKVIQTRMF